MNSLIKVLARSRLLKRHNLPLGDIEFAEAYRRFGSRMTVIQRGPQLLAREDPDVRSKIPVWVRPTAARLARYVKWTDHSARGCSHQCVPSHSSEQGATA